MSNLDVDNTLPDIVAKLSGKIDAENAGDIQNEVAKLLEDGVETFTFDVNDVTYVSSAGLRMFSALAKTCKDRGISYTLLGLRKDIVRMFQLTGYASVFKIVPKQEV